MKNILLLLAVFAVATFAQNTTSSGNATSIRVFHGVTGGPNVDVYHTSVTQGNILASNLSPGTVSEYRNVTLPNPQSLDVIVTQAGSTTNIIANKTVSLTTNFKAGTILIAPAPNATAGNATAGNATAGNATNLNVVVLNDQFNNGQPAPANSSLLRFVNVVASNGTNAAQASALTLRFNNGTALFSNVNFLNTDANYVSLPPGNYNMEVVPASGGQPIATQSVNVAAGQALTLFAFIPVAGGAAALARGTDSVIAFTPVPPVIPSVTSGAAVTSGSVTSGAVTSGAVTSGAVTSGAAATSGVAATTGTTGVLITGFTTGLQRPVNAAGTLRCDVATLGVVCAILFTVFYRRD